MLWDTAIPASFFKLSTSAMRTDPFRRSIPRITLHVSSVSLTAAVVISCAPLYPGEMLKLTRHAVVWICYCSALGEAGTPINQNRTLMLACTMGLRVNAAITGLLNGGRTFLTEHQPFVFSGQTIDVSVLKMENIGVYGLQSVYLRNGTTIKCNATALQFLLTLGAKDVRLVLDWSARVTCLRGKANVSIGTLEADVTGTAPAQRKARVVLETVKIVTLDGVRVIVSGPRSAKAISFNTLVSGVLGSQNRDAVIKKVEAIVMVTVQQFLDKMNWLV